MATKLFHVYGNKMSISIPLHKVIRTLLNGEVTEYKEDFSPNPNYPTVVKLYKSDAISYSYEPTVSGNIINFSDDGSIRIGDYNIEVTCRDENAESCRFMAKDAVSIVDATKDAHIEEGIEFDANTYTLDGAVFPSYGVGGRVIWDIGRIESPDFSGHTWGEMQELVTNDAIAFILRSNTSGTECYHYISNRIQQGGATLLEVSFMAINGNSITMYTLTNSGGRIGYSIRSITLG